ncbi:MAG TPA: YfhO family protein [Thermoanaerobaculia bacterium]|nr:YfhO family protein [Thermoanaerobaculia bacterium]
MSLLLFAISALALLFICHRTIRPISRAAAVILFLLPFCFTGLALLTDRVYGPVDFAYMTEPLLPMKDLYGIGQLHNGIQVDLHSQMIPWRKALQWSLSRGEWPLLNPFILSGDILAAAAQPAAYSPFTLLSLLLPVASGLTFSAAVAFFVAGLASFLFARELGCGEAASLFGAAASMYATGLSFFILWPLGFSWAFLPLVLLGARRVVREPGVPSALLLTIAFTLLLLAGHPETALHVVAIGAVYALVELLRVRRNVPRAVIGGVAAGALALLLSAIYLLPVLQAVEQTIEHEGRRTLFATTPRGVPIQAALARLATDFFPFLHVRPWRVPAGSGVPIDSAAVGSLVLAAAIFAMWRVRSADSWFFTGLAVFGLFARSEWIPLARLMQKLPLFDIALNERFSFAASFALAMLAALAVQYLWSAADPAAARPAALHMALTFTIVLIALSAGTVMILRADLAGPNPERWGDFKIAADIGVLALATLVIIAPVPRRLVIPALLGLLLLQRTAMEGGVYRVVPASAAYPPVPIFEPLKNRSDLFRVTGVHLTFIPGMSAMYGLEDVRGYQAMTNARYYGTYRLWCRPQPVWFNRIEDLTRPFLSFLNVRYSVVWGRYPVPEGWRVAAEQRGAKLLENSSAIERAFIPRRVRLGMSDSDSLTQMAGQADFRDVAWIRASLEPHERDNGPGTVSIRRARQGYDLDVSMASSGWVVVSNVAWEGWRAYIDGRRVQMQIANTAFLGVYVPEGRHEVRLVFRPERFVVGRTVTFATLALMIVFLVVRRLRRA